MTRQKLSSLLLEAIPGSSPEINQLRKSVQAVIGRDQHVLIVGEPGTEKMQIAQAIANLDDPGKAFIVSSNANRLNAAFEQEIRSTIVKQNPAQLAGFLIIEDVDQLSASAQTRVLNFANPGYFAAQPDGPMLETHFRILSTCSQNWLVEGKETFDSELFLSLSGLVIKIPPLRERRQDIPVLMEKMLGQICGELERSVPSINFEVFNQMLKYDWPGNVKELLNVVRTLIVSSPENELTPEALPFYNQKQQFNKLELQSLGLAVAQLEKELIERALRKFAGNQSRAAQILSISEANLRFKMKKLGIRKHDFVTGM